MPDARCRKRGITLVEMLVVMVILAILTVAIGYAFTGELDLERQQAKSQSQQALAEATERRITTLIQGAMLGTDGGDATTYFIGATEGTTGTATPGNSSALGNTGDSDLGCDRLTFTTAAIGVPMASQQSDDEFETQQEKYGPVGGIAEVSWGTTAQGDDPGSHSGLFERVQQPSDGDSTQGGKESVLDADIEAIGFQFWNGTNWVTTWDTTTGERRLPQEVQVSYRRTSDPTHTTYRFLVTIPTSDVDAQNPSTNGAAAL